MILLKSVMLAYFIIESMKKLFFAVFLPLLYLFISAAPPKIAEADSYGYACIRSNSVYLYTEENDQSGLFILPYSYYVKVLSEDSAYAFVEYLSDGPSTRKITGYCKLSDLTFVDYIPLRPYLYHTFSVKYTIEDAPVGDDGFLSTMTVTCAYYGDYKVGSKSYCYVLMNDKFGYIPRPKTFSYEINDEYDNHQTAPPAGNFNSSETESGGASAAQIAVIVLLCLLIPIIAALILRPNKKTPLDPED